MELKAYKVVFGETDNEDFLNVDAKTVLATNAEKAIEEAKSLLSRKETKTYFVESVELLVSSFDAK